MACYYHPCDTGFYEPDMESCQPQPYPPYRYRHMTEGGDYGNHPIMTPIRPGDNYMQYMRQLANQHPKRMVIVDEQPTISMQPIMPVMPLTPMDTYGLQQPMGQTRAPPPQMRLQAQPIYQQPQQQQQFSMPMLPSMSHNYSPQAMNLQGSPICPMLQGGRMPCGPIRGDPMTTMACRPRCVKYI